MSNPQSEHLLVATYSSHADAADALRVVRTCGFDMKKWSILGKDVLADERAFGFYSAGEHMKFWAGDGAIWRDVWGMLHGGGFFFIPPVGPLVVMGPFLECVVDALETAPTGDQARVPAVALARIGVASHDVESCELEVRAGSFLVLAQGSAVLVESARVVLDATRATHLRLTTGATRIALGA